MRCPGAEGVRVSRIFFFGLDQEGAGGVLRDQGTKGGGGFWELTCVDIQGRTKDVESRYQDRDCIMGLDRGGGKTHFHTKPVDLNGQTVKAKGGAT